ncbi:hypothetical protein DNJ95_08700 [Stutzerimonas kirkiae]|uniref:Transcriptional regulator SutA RNAP-binding domain-containing protein n=1 Tax=Stutzerimonas kirkiae TaxID=2211392 RepID=A0A4Q9R782_9GAMM|nr:transcriptional regulator SutA [Stutzerimonas kirkiae]TBU95755.1 hypothetical protein DNJ96_11800 [Stutzerimonas kirkiae]TBV02746.1 hypothetical protein DNJ95_08700 [Stutzerimonas kirkiae]
MSDEELEQDDLELGDEAEDEAEEALRAADDSEDIADDDDEGTDSERVSASPKKAKAKASEPEELPSLEAKQRERDALARAMEEFLARGGQVQEVEANVVADPPKKPEGKYGSRPI